MPTKARKSAAPRISKAQPTPAKRITKAMLATAINEAVKRVALPVSKSSHVAISIEVANKSGFHLIRVPVEL